MAAVHGTVRPSELSEVLGNPPVRPTGVRWVLQDDSGLVGLDAFTKGDPVGRRQMRAFGFTGGYGREWVEQDVAAARTFVSSFRTAAGAHRMFAVLVRNAARDAPEQAPRLRPATIGEERLVIPLKEARLTIYTFTFRRGNIVVAGGLGGIPSRFRLEHAIAYAREIDVRARARLR